MYSENYERQTALSNAEKALDPALTDHELASFARSPEAKVRAVVAERPTTPLTSLLKLLQDESPSVRAGLARNPRPDMPEDVYLELLHDKSPEVVHALIRNRAVPDKIIAKLARSNSKDYVMAVRERLAEKGTKAKVLGVLGIVSS